MSEDYRKAIITALEILRQDEVKNKNTFKARAYKNVIDQLRVLGSPVRGFEDLTSVKGIGEKIHQKIQEIFETGSLKRAQELSKDTSAKAIEHLTGVYGIGPTKAKELVDLGIMTVADLRSSMSKNPNLLNDKQKIGLVYYEDLIQRIPREEMLEHQRVIKKCIRKTSKELKFEIVGSFRRGATSSGDIDILITGPTSDWSKYFKPVVSKMITEQYVTEVLAIGDKKFMGICACDSNATSRRIDILFTPPEEYAYALLYFTGSQEFNIKLRQRALDLGWSINEHRIINIDLTKIRDPPVLTTEKQIFDFLGLKYIEAENR
jgi:DNA polymerase beta